MVHNAVHLASLLLEVSALDSQEFVAACSRLSFTIVCLHDGLCLASIASSSLL